MFSYKRETMKIEACGRKMELIILRPKEASGPLPGLLWIHGGGYATGLASMVYVSRAVDLLETSGCVVVSPDYRRSGQAPYPAALEDCYAALVYMSEHGASLGIDPSLLMVGGESAGGGLAAALSLYARDKGGPDLKLQFPLYPMIDCEDTDSSRDNHGITWNTARNHAAWKLYLGELYGSDNVPAYASPSRASDLSGLPPCYTFVCTGEPFYDETLAYVSRLKAAGVDAEVDVYPGSVHAFDMVTPFTVTAKRARAVFREKASALYKEYVKLE